MNGVSFFARLAATGGVMFGPALFAWSGTPIGSVEERRWLRIVQAVLALIAIGGIGVIWSVAA